MLNRWQSTIVDTKGNVKPHAVLTIRNESDQSLATVYMRNSKSQPYPLGTVSADAFGYAYFYAPAGLYRIQSNELSIDWRHVDIGAAVATMIAQQALDNDLPTYVTLADMQADTDQPVNTMGRVVDDPAESTNGFYLWDGAAWNRTSLQPASVEDVDAVMTAAHEAQQSAIEAADSADLVQIKEQEREQIFEDAQDERENEFSASQIDKQNRFNDFIAASGYQFLGDYATGITLTEYNQVIRDSNGELWRVSGQVELPYTTTGAGLPENDAFVSVGDAALRQELAMPGGAALVGQGVMAVNTIADLQALPAGQRKADMRYLVKEYHAGNGVGGGVFSWVDGDLSSQVVNDPLSGVYVAPNGSSGSQGAFQRIGGELNNFHFGAREGDYDSFINNQAFLDWISKQPSKNYALKFKGDTKISQTLEFGGLGDRVLDFDARIRNFGGYVDGPALRIGLPTTNANYVNCTGTVRVLGNGVGGLSRGFKYGFEMNNAGRAKFSYLNAADCKYWGVKVNPQSNIGTIEKLVTRSCGFRNAAAHPEASATYEIISKEGGNSSTAQRTHLKITGVVHEAEDCQLVKINNSPYLVVSADTDTNTLVVYPNIEGDIGSVGDLQYFAGGGIRMRSNDVGIWNVGSMEATHCGISVYSGSLYGSNFNSVVSQYCGVGILIGQGITNVSYSSLFTNPYFEATEFHILKIGNSSHATIIEPFALNLSRSGSIAAGSASGTSVLKGLGSIVMIKDGFIYSESKQTYASANLSVADSSLRAGIALDYRVDNFPGSLDIRLQEDSENSRLFGPKPAIFILYKASGSVRFYPFDETHTVMGGAEYVMPMTSDCALIIYSLVGTDWKVHSFNSSLISS